MKLGAFKFPLTAEELVALRSQFVTSNDKDSTHTTPGSGGRRYATQVFTEHGALMAATVLNSPRAVKVAVGLGEFAGGVQVVAVDGVGLAFDHCRYGHGAAGGG